MAESWRYRPPGLPPADKDFKGLEGEKYSDQETDSDEEGLLMKPVPPRSIPFRVSRSIRKRKEAGAEKEKQAAGPTEQ